MVKIVAVNSLGRDMIDVHLDSGSILLLNLMPFLTEPRFSVLLEDDRILWPKTDGQSVFWTGGPKLSITEIVKMMQQP